jgi:cysteine-rich repeat protein
MSSRLISWVSCSLLASLLVVACGSSDDASPDPAGPGGGSQAGEGGAGQGGSGLSGAGQGGDEPGGQGGSAKGGAGQSGAGAAGAKAGAGGAGTCPPAHLDPLPDCKTSANPCIACLCEQCDQDWVDCTADPGCSDAVACVGAGCSLEVCVTLAPGSSLSKALAVSACRQDSCAAACSGGMGGAGGAAGSAGSGGGGAGGKGGNGGTAGVSGGGQSGAGGGCTAASCDDTNECTTDTCSGTCTHANDDAHVPAQGPAGDCQKQVCASGKVASVADDTDAPPAADPCAPTSCAGGKLVTGMLADGMGCTLGGKTGACAAGKCATECSTPADCDDTNACTTDTCDAGKCGHAPLADNTATPGFTEVAGDCTRHVCKGGVSTAVADAADAPPPASECATASCQGMTPTTGKQPDGQACTTGGDFCLAGVCHPNSCGDGIQSGTEACDGADLAGKDCTAVGLGPGPGVACKADCSGFDVGSCKATCGNGVLEPGEDCDDAASPGAPGDGCSKYCRVEPKVGDLVITEMLFNPAAVSDAIGEWFEVYNASAQTIDLRGLLITSATTGVPDGETIVIDGGAPIEVPSKGYVVLGNLSDMTMNGGVAVAFAYGTKITMANSNLDDIRLYIDTTPPLLLDAAGYTKANSGAAAYSGASFSLNPTALSATANDLPASWCAAKTVFGAGDKGTPGAKNDACP